MLPEVCTSVRLRLAKDRFRHTYPRSSYIPHPALSAYNPRGTIKRQARAGARGRGHMRADIPDMLDSGAARPGLRQVMGQMQANKVDLGTHVF